MGRIGQEKKKEESRTHDLKRSKKRGGRKKVESAFVGKCSGWSRKKGVKGVDEAAHKKGRNGKGGGGEKSDCMPLCVVPL